LRPTIKQRLAIFGQENAFKRNRTFASAKFFEDDFSRLSIDRNSYDRFVARDDDIGTNNQASNRIRLNFTANLVVNQR